jgi:hypothetical protein
MITILLFQVIDKFFCIFLCFTINQHAYLPLLGSDHYRLFPHAAYHIEGITGLAPQSQFQCVLFHTLLQRLFKLMMNFKKSVCRA